MQGNDTIFLRLYVAVDNYDAAMPARLHAERILKLHGLITRSDDPKPYWKIPEYFEVYIELQPHGHASEVFGLLLPQLANGWEIHRTGSGGDWAVWNPKPNCHFTIDGVRWANLECFHSGSPST